MDAHEPTTHWTDNIIDRAWAKAEIKRMNAEPARDQELARWWVRRIIWNLKARKQ